MSRTELVLTNLNKKNNTYNFINKAKYLLVISYLVFWTFSPSCEACLCHLIPNYTCPPPPHCCESGQYTYDECGCCLTCAKSELQPCGGASGSSGKCAQGLACLKTCTPCKTIGRNPEPCIFPFEYQGRHLEKCTTIDAAESGTAWCATEVYENQTVVDGRWGDCDEGCPGARRECDDRRFSILIGKCINPNVPGAIPNWVGAPPYRLLDKTSDLVPAPLCSTDNSKRRRLYANTCRCAEGEDTYDIDEDGSIRGNCTGVDNDGGDSVNTVWCFLENIRDPFNPSSGCYPDTTWSPKDGRFWSSEACNGLPPLDNDQSFSPKNINNILGEKNPLFKAALNTPFKKPEDVFNVKTRTATPKTPDAIPPTPRTPGAAQLPPKTPDAAVTKPRRQKITTEAASSGLDLTTRTPARRRKTTTPDSIGLDLTTSSSTTTTPITTTTETTTTSEATPTTTTRNPITTTEDVILEENEELEVNFDAEKDDSSELQSVLDENRAFFETDDNFEIATTKKETTQDDVSNVTTTTSRVGRNPGDQDSPQYYDDSEVYDDKTEFTDIDDLYYFDTNNDDKNTDNPKGKLTNKKEEIDYENDYTGNTDNSEDLDKNTDKNEETEFEKDDNANADKSLMNLPIVNQRENGLEFLPTPIPLSRRRQKIVDSDSKVDNDFQDFDGSDPPPLTTRRTTEASFSSGDNFGDRTTQPTANTETTLPTTYTETTLPTTNTETSLPTTSTEQSLSSSEIGDTKIDFSTDSVTDVTKISSKDNNLSSFDTLTSLEDISTTTVQIEEEKDISTDKMSVEPTKVDTTAATGLDDLTTSQGITETTTTTTANFESTTPTKKDTTDLSAKTTTTPEVPPTIPAKLIAETSYSASNESTSLQTTTTTPTTADNKTTENVSIETTNSPPPDKVTIIATTSPPTTTSEKTTQTTNTTDTTTHHTTDTTTTDTTTTSTEVLNNSTEKTEVTQAQRSAKSQNIVPDQPKIDLGIFGSFWLEKPVQVGEVSETERPSPVFRVEDYTDKFPV